MRGGVQQPPLSWGPLGGLRVRAPRHLLELGLSQECLDVLEQQSRNFLAPGTLSWKIFSQMGGGEDGFGMIYTQLYTQIYTHVYCTLSIIIIISAPLKIIKH